MRDVELVIFDCDGVLVDSERLAVRVETALMNELGWALTEDEVFDRFVGRSDAHMLAEIEAALGHPVPEWDQRYREQLHAVFRSELRPVDGIVAALDQLSMATCVASSGTHDKIALTLGLTGLSERFRGRIFSATEVANGKPAPDLFLHAAAQCAVAPARCVVVEDSQYGVAAAGAAGMRVLGYCGGLTPVAHLAAATAVFDDMAALPDLLAQLGRAATLRSVPPSAAAEPPRTIN